MAVSLAYSNIQPLASDHTTLGKIVVVDITFDSSYPTGGEAVSIEELGLAEVWNVSFNQKAPLTTTLVYQWDFTNKKVIASWVDTSVDGAALAEVTDTTNLSTYTVRATFYGLPR